MSPSKEIVLFHYTSSPFARRLVWYLQLRHIPYSQCMQPPILPRPDVQALGVAYRRIPLMSIGRDIYNDTRLIISKLEQLFPASSQHPGISSVDVDSKAIERLLSFWVIDGPIFARASQMIPSSMPLLQDEKFRKDREQMSGRSWDQKDVERMRPEAIVEIQAAFEFLENGLLADGREWILKTSQPTLADIEAVWPLHWLVGMKVALEERYFPRQKYRNTFAWIDRFSKFIKEVSNEAGKAKTIKGEEAMKIVGTSDWAEEVLGIQSAEPSGLKDGQMVEVWPTDSGFKNRDKGKLVGLTGAEIVWESETADGKTVRVHSPRHGFRVRALKEGSKL